MRTIYIENEKWEYDIRELAKIFLPSEDYEVIVHKTGAEKNEVKRQLYHSLSAETGYRPPWGILTGVRPLKILDKAEEKGILKVRLEASPEDMLEASPKDVLEASPKDMLEASPKDVLEASAKDMLEASPKDVLEASPKDVTKDALRNMLKQEYLVSDAKIDLLLAIRDNQKLFFERVNTFNGKNGKQSSLRADRPVGIYIGIPFCPSRCAYCSFPAAKISEQISESYLKALEKEAKAVGKMMEESGLTAESVYIGGGTPTSLSESEMDRLFLFLMANLPIKDVFEFTVEAGRPDTVTAEKLAIIKAYGADRISINPQTMKDETLSLIGRRHTADDVRKAVALVKESGISVVNMDMIAGLPGENAADFVKSLNEVIDMSPQNITVHTLAIKKSSKFKEEHVRSRPEDVQAMVDFSQYALSDAGYRPYYVYRQKYMSANLENVGYCLPGTEGCYNIRIMEERQTVIAIGAGGISKFYFPHENRLERVPNVSNYEIYTDRIDDMIQRKLDFFLLNKTGLCYN